MNKEKLVEIAEKMYLPIYDVVFATESGHFFTDKKDAEDFSKAANVSFFELKKEKQSKKQ